VLRGIQNGTRSAPLVLLGFWGDCTKVKDTKVKDKERATVLSGFVARGNLIPTSLGSASFRSGGIRVWDKFETG